MKKLFIVTISLLMLIVLNACNTNSTTTTKIQTTTLISVITETQEKLDTPQNIEINSNVITFDSVSHAEKYKLSIKDSNGALVNEYNISSGFDLSLLLQIGTYSCTLKATALNYLDSDKSSVIDFTIVDESSVTVIEGNDMNNLSLIRWMGRTYYSESESLTYFFFTASGFEVAFFGTKLEITLKANKYNVLGKEPHIVVLIDGEENPLNGQTYKLQNEEEVITIDHLSYGYHTVKVLKRSEASDSNTALKEVETDGYFTLPTTQKPFKIQYIAASSSTGFGNLGTVSESKTTANSNGLLAYAYLASYLLDAETSIFSASGWGVSRGWNTAGLISEYQNIPYAYVNKAIDDTNKVFTSGSFDYSNYIPDVLVVNLGTNDFNASGYQGMSEQDKADTEQRFLNDYVDFLVVLNNLYPDAKIIIAYGLMNEAPVLGDITLEVINRANLQIGSTIVYDFLMEPAGSNNNPFGCAYHPNVQTGMNVAEDLALLISQITGKQIVREMISYE